MEEEKATEKRETIACPKDPDKLYFKVYCETVFRVSNFRPLCQKCPHFTATTVSSNREKRTGPGDE
jgi:hypothetical protein